MTPHQSIAVGVRLFAVWLVLNILGSAYAALIQIGKSDSALALAIGLVITWLAVGCALIGTWVMVSTLPYLAGDILAFSAYGDSGEIDWRMLLENRSAYSVLRIALGIWLILGASGLRKLFWWARNAGVRPSGDVRDA